ncbi:MAG TPA: nicotinate phosphoribosyltransferase [Gemmatimonadales bacterium]|nr:nicotinate phosphoribosyltransferase [Gemmatimonadales bacterium]
MAAAESPPGTFRSGPLLLESSALFTDLYQLTMAAAFFREGLLAPATFSLFARRLPPSRGFLVAAGLEDALEYLGGLRFDTRGLAYLASLGRFEPGFLEYLAGLRFTGQVRAVPEGTVLGAEAPLLEVTAPIVEAQMVETALLNLCHVQSVIASKAARVAIAARGRPVAEFGLRRSHGTDAGLKAARCARLAGCEHTSNVLAGATWNLPLAGTMAHSFVAAFADELEAFRAYARAFPDAAVLLIDTYDTREGARRAARVAAELAAAGHRLAGVRLDSGNLDALSRGVRRILDEAGFPEVPILASGGLDEHDIDRLLGAGAPIDAFGIGTRMNVSADAPSLDLVYKLVRFAGRDVLKLSEGKETWVGAKQLHRARGDDGRLAGDLLAVAEDAAPPGTEPLLETVMRDGRLLRPHPPLPALRERCAAQLAALPEECRRLEDPTPYPVRPSHMLRARQADAAEGLGVPTPPPGHG